MIIILILYKKYINILTLLYGLWYYYLEIKQLIMREKIPFEVALPKSENELYQYFTNDELEATAKELTYIAEHPEEYKSYESRKDLKEALLSDD